MWTIVTRRWLFKLFILGISIAGVCFDFQYPWAEKIISGLVFTMALFLVEQAYETHRELHEAKEESAHRFKGLEERAAQIKSQMDDFDKLLRSQMEHLADLIGIERKQREIARAIEDRKDLITPVLGRLHTVMIDSLDVCSDGFVVRDHALALSSYYDFWRTLTAEQKRRRDNPGLSNLTVHIVHSCGIEIWKDSKCEDILWAQQEFVKANGEIHRILCGHAEVPDADYQTVAKQMTDAGIKVTYYPINRGEQSHDYSTDFLSIEELGCVVTWKSNAVQKIDEAHYSMDPHHDNGDHYEDIWVRFAERAEAITDGSDI